MSTAVDPASAGRESLLAKDVLKAREYQVRLQALVRIVSPDKTPSSVAGVDAAFAGDSVVAVCSLFSLPALEPLEDAVCREATSFPYVPGYLSFREGPALLGAVERLSSLPGLLLVDGQGIAHPRRFGIASHLGVLLGLPTIGCAKNRLSGWYEEPPREKGSWTPLYEEEGSSLQLGAVLRTRDNVKPLFVSPGHLIDIPSSVNAVM